MEQIIGPDDPITFAEAASLLLRGLVTASTLRAAAERGELQTERLGRRVVTTPAHIKEWRRRCRVSPESRTSNNAAMASGESQQAAAIAMLKALRN